MYQKFLESKIMRIDNLGFDITENEINPILFDFQKAIVKWSIKKGRCAVMIDCGLGKSFIQLEWLRLICEKFNQKGLIIAPLSVAHQTIKEAEKLGINLTYAENQENIKTQLSITNYERLHNFNSDEFIGIVLDESSILKSISGKIKKLCFNMFVKTKFKLSCTATPAPNDISEIANQAQFLGIMKREEMLSKFFLHRDMEWEIKGHAKQSFYFWISQWAVFARKPLDLGFNNENYNLPALNIEAIWSEEKFCRDGELFSITDLKGIQDRLEIKRKSMQKKAEIIIDFIKDKKKQFIIWCGLNEESDYLEKYISGSVQLSGKQMQSDKIKEIENFKNGKTQILITKPKIAGFGMNFQNCHNMIFFGLSDSYESYYQCIRRCWRYGQKEKVNIYIVLNVSEQAILNNVITKEKHSNDLFNGVIAETSEILNTELHGKTYNQKDEYMENIFEGKNWKLYNADSCIITEQLENESIDMMIYSPPFASLYTYSNSIHDLGNSKDYQEFFNHLSYITKNQLRILKQGRICCVHVSQIPAMLVRDGYIGLKDFRGDIIKHYTEHGFIYHGEVCIYKNPQAQSIRTHSKGLTFSQLEKDSSWNRPALADYILIFRKPGENKISIDNEHNGITRDDWINYASPIWMDVCETDILKNKQKSENDEKHICPLQLEPIKRCILLYSNKNEIVFSPFAGIGSEGYMALKLKRKFIGIELKPEYAKIAVENLKEAEYTNEEKLLFSLG